MTTGYGDSVTRPVPTELVPELPLHLTRFHGCGLGRISSSMPPAPCWRPGSARWRRESPGSARPCSSGSAGCWAGSGAAHSGRGVGGRQRRSHPLSYVAAVLVGARASSTGSVAPRRRGLSGLGSPLTLRPKEGLALMNGTSVMTALACLAYARTDYLMRLATRITALVSVAMGATPSISTSGCLPPSPPRHAGHRGLAEEDLVAGELPRPATGCRTDTRCAVPPRHRGGGRQPALVAPAH